MRYIDALFFGSGAATQSGLNTVDVNKLNTWQQAVLMLVSMVTNPITINGFVVFLRLYWFEKRFQNIAKESSRHRRSLAQSFSKSKTTETARDTGDEERGVNGRNIVVMHNTTRGNGTTNGRASVDLINHLEKGKEPNAEMEERARSRSSNDSGSSSAAKEERQHTSDGTTRPAIKFADQLRVGDGVDQDGNLRTPIHRSPEEHIAILQRQRNQEDDGAVLRIPGPRDADAGITPQTVDGSDPMQHVMSRRSTTSIDPNLNLDASLDENTPAKRNITITEPTRSPVNERIASETNMVKHVLSVLKFRKPRIVHDEKLHEDKNHPQRTNTFHAIKRALSSEKTEGMAYLSWEPTVGRNSMFVDLTEEQREELGGIEYRSLKSLALIVTLYFWGFWIFGLICLLPWILHSPTYGAIVKQDGQGRAWWGVFTASSAFTDLGFTLTPDSMISFGTAVWPLLLMSFLIIIGNTGFPIMLRLIIWGTSLWVPKESGIWEELQFLLDHPRRCFTLLFPSAATWWLLAILIILNGIDLILFIVLDLGYTIVTQLPVNIRILDGWFQAVSTRTAGFGVVNLAELHPAIQVSYLIMMYISVFPIAISVRRTNVYEEKSLGIYGSQTEEREDEGEPSYIGAHLRRQLEFDLWFIFVGFFIISISEGTRIQDPNQPAFTLFSVLFEIVSAYGTVGLSLGYTDINASFSAEFGVIAKLVIIAMQVRGRHRGLPYDLDKAILLPSDHLQKKEAEDAATIPRRRSSAGTANQGIFNSGTSKSERSMSRARSRNNLLGNLLHPGPSMPDNYRRNDEIGTQRRFSRRHSVAVPPTERRGRTSVSLSPTRQPDARPTRVEGRRSFFQDGVNPEPKDLSKQS